MILVVTGTHVQPFDRLVRAAEELAQALDEEVVVQGGPSRVPTPRCTRHDLLPPSELQGLLERARAVVVHGGPGSILEALAAGHRPVVVPRDPAHGEHVDEHQLRFVEHLGDEVVALADPSRLRETLESVDHPPGSRGDVQVHAQRSERFAHRLERLVGEVLARPTSLRARLARAVGTLLGGLR